MEEINCFPHITLNEKYWSYGFVFLLNLSEIVGIKYFAIFVKSLLFY